MAIESVFNFIPGEVYAESKILSANELLSQRFYLHMYVKEDIY